MNASYAILENKTLSDDQSKLSRIKYEVRYSDGESFTPTHELYDIGNAAAVLLYDKERKTVVLTRQFRLPAALNGKPDGMLLEACAGKLDGKSPEDTVRHEAKEELGYTLDKVQKVITIYSSPGSLIEKVDLFVAPYTPAMKTDAGGGLEEENEHIEAVEISFEDAVGRIEKGEIQDAKTIILLQHLRMHDIL